MFDCLIKLHKNIVYFLHLYFLCLKCMHKDAPTQPPPSRAATPIPHFQMHVVEHRHYLLISLKLPELLVVNVEVIMSTVCLTLCIRFGT